MSLVLTGVVTGMRPVGGTVEDGPRKGEKWNFLSMEIVDTRFGKVYSCQLRSEDAQYKEFVGQDNKLVSSKDLTDHKVRVTVKAQSAAEREIDDKATNEKRTIMQIRSQITKIEDLGFPDDEG